MSRCVACSCNDMRRYTEQVVKHAQEKYDFERLELHQQTTCLGSLFHVNGVRWPVKWRPSSKGQSYCLSVVFTFMVIALNMRKDNEMWVGRSPRDQDIGPRDTDEIETLSLQTETRPRHWASKPRRDRDIEPPDWDEIETLRLETETRPRLWVLRPRRDQDIERQDREEIETLTLDTVTTSRHWVSRPR